MADVATQNNDFKPPFFQGPLGRFEKRLRDAGMKDEEIAFLSGRVIQVVTGQMAVELQGIMGKSGFEELEKIADDTERNKKIDSILQEKKGIGLQKYQEDKLEEFVVDFESKGNSTQLPK